MLRTIDEHSPGHRRIIRRSAVGVLVLVFTGSLAVAHAADPPRPDFYWPYGTVQLSGANLEPPVQPVIALVNGQACGASETLVPEAGVGIPVGDVGKTAYVVNVLADGASAGQLRGCGKAGDPVTLYFPVSKRFAVQTLSFEAGSQRANLELGEELGFRLVGQMLANDGAP